MSDLGKKEDELLNRFNNEIFVHENSEMDNDDDLVLEVDDKPWGNNYLEDENYLISNDLLHQLNPSNIDFNINPFNKERLANQSESEHLNDKREVDNNHVFNFVNQSESHETKESGKETNLKIPTQHKPLPRVTSHPIQPQSNIYSNINFPNNSFTMNGKSGWICPSCKNFNYEMRTQCNRCGRAQILFNYNMNSNTNANLNSQFMNGMNMNYNNNNILKQNDFLSSNIAQIKYSHSYSPKAKKNEDKKKKPFIEREGDWICYKCKNLNFAFRTNCNRCNLTMVENQKIIQTYMNSYTNVQLVNKSELDEIHRQDRSGIDNYFNTPNIKSDD